MATFLVTWNPDSYPRLTADWDEVVAQSGSAVTNWSMGNRKSGVKQGDKVFMVRQIRDRGIVLSGVFVSEIYQDDHWIKAKADAGKIANYADIKWERQTDLDDELPTDVLIEKIPQVPWNVLLGSGVSVPAEAEVELERLWDAHTRPSASDGEPIEKAEVQDVGGEILENNIVRVLIHPSPSTTDEVVDQLLYDMEIGLFTSDQMSKILQAARSYEWDA